MTGGVSEWLRCSWRGTGLGKEFILKPKGYGSQRGFSAGGSMCFHFHFWLMVILESSKTTNANKGMLAPPRSARERGKASEYQIHDLLPFWRGDNQEPPLGPPGSSCKLKIKCGSCETSLPVICIPRDGGEGQARVAKYSRGTLLPRPQISMWSSFH